MSEPATAAASKARSTVASAGAPNPTTETTEQPRPVVQIRADTLKFAEHERNSWVCVVPTGTTAEDLDQRPEVMVAIADQLHKGDLITAWTADDSVMFD